MLLIFPRCSGTRHVNGLAANEPVARASFNPWGQLKLSWTNFVWEVPKLANLPLLAGATNKNLTKQFGFGGICRLKAEEEEHKAQDVGNHPEAAFADRLLLKLPCGQDTYAAPIISPALDEGVTDRRVEDRPWLSNRGRHWGRKVHWWTFRALSPVLFGETCFLTKWCRKINHFESWKLENKVFVNLFVWEKGIESNMWICTASKLSEIVWGFRQRNLFVRSPGAHLDSHCRAEGGNGPRWSHQSGKPTLRCNRGLNSRKMCDGCFSFFFWKVDFNKILFFLTQCCLTKNHSKLHMTIWLKEIVWI